MKYLSCVFLFSVLLFWLPSNSALAQARGMGGQTTYGPNPYPAKVVPRPGSSNDTVGPGRSAPPSGTLPKPDTGRSPGAIAK
jgi:hypothetical protein